MNAWYFYGHRLLSASSALTVAVLMSGANHLPGQGQAITFTNFSDTSLLQLNGSATAATTADGPVLQLTPAAINRAGSVFLKSPVSLGNRASFSTFFNFRLSRGGGLVDVDGVPGADGIVFVVQTVANNVGSLGGGLGYMNISNSVGIEFDTWYNTANPALDPQLPAGQHNPNGTTGDGNHVAINFDGNLIDSVYAHIGDPLNNGNVWYAWIDYNGVTGNLELRVSETATRPASPILTNTVNLLNYLGTTNAYLGFTGATGGAYNQQDILFWQFSTQYQPIGTVTIETDVTNQLITAGAPAMLAISALGTAPLRYQWFFNGTNLTDNGLIVGSQSNILTISSTLVTDTGNYQVIVTNQDAAATSAVAVLTVGVPPKIVDQPHEQAVAAGTDAMFSVGATGTDPLTYYWLFKEAALISTTTGSLVISNTHVADGGNYQVIVSNAFGSVTSVLATLSVLTPPAIIKPPANAQVIAGNPATFAVAATSSGPLTYQWLFGDVPIPGATNFTFTIGRAKLTDSGDYSVQVANLAASILSPSAGLLVLPAPAPLVPLSSYTINIQSGLNLIANQLDNGGNTLNEILPEVPDGSIVAKFDNASQTWSESSFNASLRAWVPSSIILSPGEGAFFQSSSNFTLTFTGTPHVPVLPVTIPGGTAWLVSRQTNDVGTYENITGIAPAPGAVVYKWDPAAAMYTTYSYSEGGWSAGVEPTAGVGEALWIAPSGGGPVAIPVPPAITQPPASLSVTQGGSATFTVAATGTEPLQYQWQLNGNNLTGANSNSLTISNVQPENAGNYSVVVNNLIGIANSTVVSLSISDLFNLPFADNFADAGSIGSATNGTGTGTNAGATTEPGEPAPHFISGGASVWLSWQPQVSGLATFTTAGSSFDTVLAVYTGSSLSNLFFVAADDDSAPFLCSLLSFDAVAGTTYYIQVEGFHGATGSVVLSWNLAAAAEQTPVILIQPQGQTALPGSNVTLSVTIQVGPSVLYQWFVNNVAVPGATDSVLTLSNLNPALVGLYQVSATNPETLAGVISESASVQLIVADNGQQGSPNDVHAQDKFGNATDLTPPDPNIPRDPPPASSYTGSQTFSTVGATSDPSEPAHCGYPACGSYWLSYQAPASGLLTINTKGTGFNAILEAYTGAGTSFSTLSPVACSANHGVTAGETVTFAATSGTIYWVVIQGVNCATGNATINFFLSASPAFTLLPVSQTTASGSQVGLIASAVGAPALGYQWQFNGNNIPNATNNSLVLPTLQTANEGSYTVVATNLFGTNISPAALVFSSNPRLLNPVVTNGVFFSQFIGVANTNYIFQTSTDLTTWLPLSTNKSPLGIINLVDPAHSGDSRRYYRAKAQ